MQISAKRSVIVTVAVKKTSSPKARTTNPTKLRGLIFDVTKFV